MGIDLSSFRTAVAGNGQWLSVQSGDMSKVVGSAGKQEIDVSDLKVAQGPDDMNKAANNIYMRGQLLENIRSSLSGMEQTQAVKDFMAKAEKTLFGELKDGQYGVDTASQDLSSATVKELLSQLDSLTGTTTVEVKSGGNVQVDEWQMVDMAEEDLTTAQKDLREKCPNATGKQISALIDLDRTGLANCLGLSGSGAMQLQVQSVKPSEIEGFLECSVSGPNSQTYDVLVDQAGVFFNKDQLSAEQVKAAYDELDGAMDGIVISTNRHAVVKSFAYSDVKVTSDLLKAIAGVEIDSGDVLRLGAGHVKGVLVNKLHAALDQTRTQRTPGSSVQENIVSLWKALGIKAPVPKKNDPALVKKFFTEMQRTVVDDHLDALNVGMGGSREDKRLREDIFKFLTLPPDADEYEKAEGRLGFEEGKNAVNGKLLEQFFVQACEVDGVPYDVRLKCLQDPSYIPGKDDFFVVPAPDEDMKKHLFKEVLVLKNEKGDTIEASQVSYQHDSNVLDEARQYKGYKPTGETKIVSAKKNCVILKDIVVDKDKETSSTKFSDVDADLYEKEKNTTYAKSDLVRSVSYYPDMLESLKNLGTSRYLGIQFKLTRPVKPKQSEQESKDPRPTELETVRIFAPQDKSVAPQDKYVTDADKVEKSIQPLKDEQFSDAQICQLLLYTNNGYLASLSGLGMQCNGRETVFEISRDANGDMRVVGRTPSTRYAGLAKAGDTHRLLMRKTENDVVNEFVIRQDGSAKLESIRFEQNPERKGRTSLIAL
ncbi:MAG: hypothetical protein MJ249_14830 [Kiritimatiellae bacterium]|nr:hypothetical protein [Kiritimatiellia bacterium]